MNVPLYIQLKNYGVIESWTEFKTLDDDLATAMLEEQLSFMAKIKKERDEIRAKEEAEQAERIEMQERIANLNNYADQFNRHG